LKKSAGYHVISNWLAANKMQAFPFQEQTWQQLHNGNSGLVNAPTGCGKTYAVFLGSIIQFINQYPKDYAAKTNSGLQLLWITPLRALAKDIGRAMEAVITELNMNWKVGIRNGDTSTAERKQQKNRMPEVLIITPESLQLLLAQKGNPEFFKMLRIIAVDEWHELLGSKRGVQTELSISRIVHLKQSLFNSTCSVWGISATIGNLVQAKEVLMAPLRQEGIIISTNIKKQITVESVLPDEIEHYPWSGHLGLKLVNKVVDIINRHKTTLIFINTRGMSETWYQALLKASPELSGAIALHHGSIEQELRQWVEDALHTGTLKAVVCTASLDLGVDFRPVDTVIQVGSPKGVARFLQRAGRSGHQPDAVSKIYFLPTHSLELVEAAALKAAIDETLIENKEPMLLCFDVLIQYLCTLAIADGFYPDDLFEEVRSTFCYADITREEWNDVLNFIVNGGNALSQYDDYKKAEITADGRYVITNRRIAMRHRMHIGTIVSDTMLKVKYMSGGFIGVIEEYFISRLQPGDIFTLAGRNLEFVVIKEMTALVRKTTAKKGAVPSWQGGRLPLSANLGKMLRRKLDEATALLIKKQEIELQALQPLFGLQKQLSHLPGEHELLVEHIETDDGFHLFVYPFEGRQVHETMAAILAYRISRILPITFSFSMNDYGFELLSDQPIPVDDSNVYELFSPDNVLTDIQKSVNSSEMARRKFRDISVIGGLIFQGFPGMQKKQRHLQSSASLLFNVFKEYEPGNMLLRQAYNEVMEQQIEEARLRSMLQRIQSGKIIITFPEKLTPFCFPLKVESIFRENISSERFEDRVMRMVQQLEK
jgi:ATP-dependent helicase Lhr and Lhr-like helicase